MPRKKVVPMKGAKTPSRSRIKRELDPKQKPGAAHMEKRARRILNSRKKNKKY